MDNQAKTRWALLVVLVAVGAALIASPNGQQMLGVGHYGDRLALEEAVKDVLKDPESAQFRNEHVRIDYRGALPILCGEVNARNSMGGYTGFQRFTVQRGGQPVFEDPDDDSIFPVLWRVQCQ